MLKVKLSRPVVRIPLRQKLDGACCSLHDESLCRALSSGQLGPEPHLEVLSTGTAGIWGVFWSCHMACRILVPQTGIEPRTLSSECSES